MSIQIKEIKKRPHFHLVTTDQALSQVCQNAIQKNMVALDTEFVRTRTFYPRLGLIQLYDGEQVNLIDPNEINDFSPFIQLLADTNVVKILHACSEDLEVFQHYFHQLPTPMIDTQVIANFLGFGNSVGFATLISHYFHLEIDKDAARTDWLNRPLSEQQLYYAAADVWYLLPLYQQMKEAIGKTRWQSAVEHDCEKLLLKRGKIKDSEQAYLNIPNVWRLERLELMRLKLLAKWRQEEAIKRDLALNFVIKGESLWLVAKYNPKHTSELLEMGLCPFEVRIHGKKMLRIIDQIKNVDEQDYPPLIMRIVDDPRYRKVLKTLQQKLKEITPVDLSTEVIAGKRLLEDLIKWSWMKGEDPEQLPELLYGWRREFGLVLLGFLQSF